MGGFRHLLLSLVLLLGVTGQFFTYYMPNANLLPCQEVAVSKYKVLLNKFHNALKGNFITRLTTTLKQLPPITKPDVMEENKENHDRDTIMLIWSWPFGFKFDVKAGSPLFGIKGCHFTDDRSQYDKAHGVMFHHRDIGGDVIYLLNMSQPPHQKWVWINMESPDNSRRHDELNDAFNLTSNYRRDSDVWVPYGRIIEASEKDKTFKIPPKDKCVCWIVSNWNPNFRRVKYFNELSQHIKIEAYGRHFNRYVNGDDYITTLSGCKFYLSFESSIHKDYFTEKLFNPMKIGTVPVVLGPPRENYEEFIPADSFIHMDDFISPQELAKYLTFLDQKQEAYERYFTWRKHFTAACAVFGAEHACRICDYVKQYKGYRLFKSLNTWYWG